MGKSVMTGNRALFKIKGVTIGAAQSVTVNDDFGIQKVGGLGNVESIELVVGEISHTISGESYCLDAETLRTLGIVPTSAEFLTAGELEIEIIDMIKGGTVELYTGAKFNTHSRTYSKHTIVSQSWSLTALHKST